MLPFQPASLLLAAGSPRKQQRGGSFRFGESRVRLVTTIRVVTLGILCLLGGETLAQTSQSNSWFIQQRVYPGGIVSDQALMKALQQRLAIETRLRTLFFNLWNHDRRLIMNFIHFNSTHFENRCPYCDYRLVEWLATLPYERKKDKRIHGLLLSRTFPALALIPYDKTDRLPTPHRVVRNAHAAYAWTASALGQRLHLGRPRPTLYADYEHYLRHELRGWAEAILFDPRTLGRGLFRPEALRSLMDRHLAGHEEWTIGKLAPLMTLEMTLRRFYD